ncbi:MAG: hypothetical protein HQ518_10975 [Rhodopirellula sp.]|nr:hypothetical protein [Rhodopirellula sp.]
MATTITSQDNPASPPPNDLWTLFPPLHLLRASGLAIDPRKMLLGGLALVLLATGDWLFRMLPFAPSNAEVHFIGTSTSGNFISQMLAHAGFLSPKPVDYWLSWDASAFFLLTPVRTLVEPGRVLFQMGNSWSSLAFAWTQLLWALIVWSLIGGALCRMNALQFAGKERLSIREALRFSGRQLIACLLAPLLPFSAILILQGANWLLGCLASFVPSMSAIVLGIMWGLVLFSGFLMAMLFLGIALGWPLMIAAISTEDSDGFDGLSRVFGYLFDRPWNAALLAVASLPIFAVTRYVVAILIGLTVSLGANAISRGYGSQLPDWRSSYYHVNSLNISPAGAFASQMEATLARQGSMIWPDSMPDIAIATWTCIPALMFAGFGPSFFWSATTVTYFLLRNQTRM